MCPGGAAERRSHNPVDELLLVFPYHMQVDDIGAGPARFADRCLDECAAVSDQDAFAQLVAAHEPGGLVEVGRSAQVPCRLATDRRCRPLLDCLA